MTILPIAYMPSVEYVARLLREECVIDLGEHYIKRSQRNRAQILSANGVMSLTVNVENANRPHQKIKDIRIDYSTCRLRVSTPNADVANVSNNLF